MISSANYDRAREDMDKRINPEDFETLEEFLDYISNLPGYSQAMSNNNFKEFLFDDYGVSKKQLFYFETQEELAEFNKKYQELNELDITSGSGGHIEDHEVEELEQLKKEKEEELLEQLKMIRDEEKQLEITRELKAKIEKKEREAREKITADKQKTLDGSIDVLKDQTFDLNKKIRDSKLNEEKKDQLREELNSYENHLSKLKEELKDLNLKNENELKQINKLLTRFKKQKIEFGFLLEDEELKEFSKELGLLEEEFNKLFTRFGLDPNYVEESLLSQGVDGVKRIGRFIKNLFR